MASANNKHLYNHYLSISPKKDKQAAVLLERFPELADKEPTADELLEQSKKGKNGKKPKG